jgi:putative membrane protein
MSMTTPQGGLACPIPGASTGTSWSPAGRTVVVWLLIACYASARVLQVYPGRIPMMAIVFLHVIPPAVFALIHGARFYQWRAILSFLAITLGVGNLFENLGVRTGFPFGHYYFTGMMGPKLSLVPILLGLAYAGMAYLSWTLARLILGAPEAPLSGWRVVTLPLCAAAIMVCWDLSQDPIWSTILHAWIWLQGGAYFGVPLSNFAGWYLTVYVIYQGFALSLKGRSFHPGSLPAHYWHQAILFYGLSAAGNLLLVIPRGGLAVVVDHAGRQWEVSDITGTCALVTVFTMGTFVLLAWARLADKGEKLQP